MSPCYLRFTHTTFDEIIHTALGFECEKWHFPIPFKHHRLSYNIGSTLLKFVPKSEELKLRPDRVSFFITQPGTYYRAHKDGSDIRFGINYPILIQDSECITSWYDDSVLGQGMIDTIGGTSREIVGFRKDNHIPLQSFCMGMGDAVLFNTDIFHDWDNRLSNNRRVILTFRSSDTNLNYNVAKEILLS